MRKTFAAFVVSVFAVMPVAAYANCSTTTYYIKGKMMTCTTCCYFGNCTTNCI